jgi:glycerol-3-phosphate dehydrogenase (NAD(P)+)
LKLPKKIAVMGAGSWGTALATTFTNPKTEVILWAHTPELAVRLREHRENIDFLPGISLPDELTVTDNIAEAVTGAGAVFSMGPAQFARDVITRFRPYLRRGAIVVNAAKGLERSTGQTMTELLEELLPDRFHKRIGVLSGPNFANEIGAGLPAATVLASRSKAAASWLQRLLSTENFRIYASTDPVGTELGGALKNIYAIAAGMLEGQGLGANMRAALISRGLAEMIRVGKALHAKAKTFNGLSGLGDLLLSCTSMKSRNYTVGYRIGRGERLPDILAEMITVAEGVPTVVAVMRLARKHDLELPIAAEIFRLLYEEKDPAQSVHDLMTRELKEE